MSKRWSGLRENQYDLKNIDLNFIKNHIKDKKFARVIIENYRDIIRHSKDSEVPLVCTGLCKVLLYDLDKSIASDYAVTLLRTIVQISRWGIKSIGMPDVSWGVHKFSENQALLGELYYDHSAALHSLNRPFACLRYLDISEKLFEFSYATRSSSVSIAGIGDSRSFYEWCRFKEIEIWLELSFVVPEEYMPVYLNILYCYATYSESFLKGYGQIKSSHDATKLKETIELGISKFGRMDEKELCKLNNTQINDPYLDWCFNKVLFLNIYNEIPNFNPDWAFDECGIDCDERARIIYEDIICSYQHCRHVAFEYFQTSDAVRWSRRRCEEVDSLVDCYIRLYSLLDKISKVIYSMFSVEVNKVSFYTVTDKLKSSSNRYLRAIYDVKEDLYPNGNFNEDLQQPLMCVLDHMQKTSYIRNCIIHGGFKIVSDSDNLVHVSNIAEITVKDLEMHVMELFYAVREIILLMKLADESAT